MPVVPVVPLASTDCTRVAVSAFILGFSFRTLGTWVSLFWKLTFSRNVQRRGWDRKDGLNSRTR